MIGVPFFVICQTVITDQRTNSLSLIGVVEQLNLEGSAFAASGDIKLAKLSPPLNIVAFITSNWPAAVGPNDVRTRIRLVLPSGRVVGVNDEPEVVSFADSTKIRLISVIPSLPIEREGWYVFELLADDQVVARAPLEVLLVIKPPNAVDEVLPQPQGKRTRKPRKKLPG